MDGIGGVDGGIRGALRGLFTFGITRLTFRKRKIRKRLTDGESKEFRNNLLMVCIMLDLRGQEALKYVDERGGGGGFVDVGRCRAGFQGARSA